MITTFPKQLPKLSKKQIKIKNEFMLNWLKILRNNYGIVDKFNHGFVVNNSSRNFVNTLEIGSGIGEHLNYEKLNEKQLKNYYAMDKRKNIIDVLKKEHPKINAIQGDCEKKLKFKSNFFDRVIAIHVLEHLPNLPKTINEVYRVLKKKGEFLIVIPCEGSIAYTIARKISAERIFKKKYKMSYDWFVKSEHINMPNEIIEIISKKFVKKKRTFFPTFVPFLFCNLCIGIIYRKN